ncbi:MAG: membrane protein insertion efficiency factor YidD [Rubricoccaceae bacterium]|nr:membrane protein insertion efficiency factor YidD [Rubricoccaceae bacterium]
MSRPPPSSAPLLDGLRAAGRFVWRLPRLALVGLVRLYQLVLSPALPASCRYSPTCSQYAVQALQTYGAVRGTVLAVWRVLRCHPWGGHGHDPPRWFTDVDRRAGEPTPEPPSPAPGAG